MNEHDLDECKTALIYLTDFLHNNSLSKQKVITIHRYYITGLKKKIPQYSQIFHIVAKFTASIPL